MTNYYTGFFFWLSLFDDEWLAVLNMNLSWQSIVQLTSSIELRCLMRIAPVMVFGQDAWCIFDFGRSRSLLRTRKTHSLCPYTRNFPDDPSGILRSAMTFLVTGHTRAMPRRGSRVKSVLRSSLGQIFFSFSRQGEIQGLFFGEATRHSVLCIRVVTHRLIQQSLSFITFILLGMWEWVHKVYDALSYLLLLGYKCMRPWPTSLLVYAHLKYDITVADHIDTLVLAYRSTSF